MKKTITKAKERPTRKPSLSICPSTPLGKRLLMNGLIAMAAGIVGDVFARMPHPFVPPVSPSKKRAKCSMCGKGKQNKVHTIKRVGRTGVEKNNGN
jgi:hypothetical protein